MFSSSMSLIKFLQFYIILISGHFNDPVVCVCVCLCVCVCVCVHAYMHVGGVGGGWTDGFCKQQLLIL